MNNALNEQLQDLKDRVYTAYHQNPRDGKLSLKHAVVILDLLEVIISKLPSDSVHNNTD